MKYALIVFAIGVAAFIIYGGAVIVNSWRFWKRADWVIEKYHELKDTYTKISSKEIKGKYYTIKFSTEEEFKKSFEVAVRHALLFYDKYVYIYKDSPEMQSRRTALLEILSEV